MRSASGGGGAPGCEEVVSERGREARNRPHTQLTAGGRTLVDADRIKAARIGDPRWRRSNRARPPTADQAIHASDGSSQGSNRSCPDHKICPRSEAVPSRQLCYF
ncbi:hypothetical protein EVAR_99864_1 [Eumeta japonica]|uniref:Uncharacterized protein n=1 Tax=Eumeta variegata TaxID=151549 RepID=A0A4C1ZIY7_EUMVA|nr:hypothetical protein EVAR_99864_1 [Eumeta japonica]